MPPTVDDQSMEARVRRETIVDNRLDGHDRRLSAINGQLERGAKAAELVAERILKMDRSIDELRAELKTKREVDRALRERSDIAIKQQVTRREFWMGIAVIVISVLSVALNAGIL